MLAVGAAVAIMACTVTANAQPAVNSDPVGDLIGAVEAKVQPLLRPFLLVASLYHEGHGIRARDSLGCPVVPMRTAAVDGIRIHRHTLLFIKETVGLRMPDGRVHDGYWYASDVGGAIHQGRIDLFTGRSAASMAPLMKLNLTKLTVEPVGEFSGCPNA
ncbi:MAG TPA: 3D domain-containing protein [Caulobacteraceae bacterium]